MRAESRRHRRSLMRSGSNGENRCGASSKEWFCPAPAIPRTNHPSPSWASRRRAEGSGDRVLAVSRQRGRHGGPRTGKIGTMEAKRSSGALAYRAEGGATWLQLLPLVMQSPDCLKDRPQLSTVLLTDCLFEMQRGNRLLARKAVPAPGHPHFQRQSRQNRGWRLRRAGPSGSQGWRLESCPRRSRGWAGPCLSHRLLGARASPQESSTIGCLLASNSTTGSHTDWANSIP